MELTPAQYRRFEEEGYILLGKLLSDAQLEALRTRVDDIMLGRIRYEGMFFQKDTSSGKYEDVDESSAYEGPSLNYRKIKDLEYDELFLAFIQNDAFHELAARYIGTHVACMRAMVMNKPARGGTILPYHQDVSAKWEMTIPPVFTIWTALDDATKANGCLEIVPHSHKHGKIGVGHMITAEEEARYAPPGSSIFVELKAGESVVFHNATLHRSGVNTTDKPRRAFTVCLMDGATRHQKTGKAYPVVFGPGALTPHQIRGITRIPAHVYEPDSR
jgi:ectoine hydroxylase-related dioxygenase (phytanoyl-CoA dioxygenase family)